MNPLKKIPEFSNEDEERAFWESHDSTDFVDWSTAERVTLPNLKPSYPSGFSFHPASTSSNNHKLIS